MKESPKVISTDQGIYVRSDLFCRAMERVIHQDGCASHMWLLEPPPVRLPCDCDLQELHKALHLDPVLLDGKAGQRITEEKNR